MKLYAWATPAFINNSPADHTWVTDYDCRSHNYPTIEDVIAAGKNCWYCWGSFHPTGAFLGSANGELGQAQCLVLPNIESKSDSAAKGTIFTYGLDGVCHQLANQVLFATTGAVPLTVSKARWYGASVFFFETYGLQVSAWNQKKQQCQGIAMPAGVKMTKKTDGSPGKQVNDAFDIRATRSLHRGNAQRLHELRALRRAAQGELTAMKERVRTAGLAGPTAAELNARNQAALDEAARILGRDKFIELFGFAPEERVNLVNPDMMGEAPTK